MPKLPWEDAEHPVMYPLNLLPGDTLKLYAKGSNPLPLVADKVLRFENEDELNAGVLNAENWR